ncbi:hypothetical protein [Hymenobacter algoricola]|uniref:Uncharacterized protein n=1 Tax=Hymenobacter algoricola TaxID=486267 RepID=A0ABP7NLI0_9BACT
MAFSQIPNPLPPEGFALPIDEIRGSFLTLGFLPGSSHNSLSPRLLLLPAGIEIKVMSASYYEYTALSRIDYRPEGFLRQERVALYFDRASGASYDFIPSSGAIRRAFLQFCLQRGFMLSPQARAAAQS